MNRAGGAKFFMLETHYDNPNLQSGIVDHSGLRLFYTSQLRYVLTWTVLFICTSPPPSPPPHRAKLEPPVRVPARACGIQGTVTRAATFLRQQQTKNTHAMNRLVFLSLCRHLPPSFVCLFMGFPFSCLIRLAECRWKRYASACSSVSLLSQQ